MAAVEVIEVPIIFDLSAIIVGALSGAATAVKTKLDVVGVVAIAIMTGLGGGLIRDLLLNTTPVALTNHWYLPTALISAVVAFYFAGLINRLGPLLLVIDALALGLFTVVGAEKAERASLPILSIVFVGVITAIGGGTIRDILTAQIPQIFKPGALNAVAAVAGAFLFLGLTRADFDRTASEVVTIVAVMAIRLVALWRGWSAPMPKDMWDVVRPRIPVRTPKVVGRAVRSSHVERLRRHAESERTPK